MPDLLDRLVAEAMSVRLQAYAPYSGYKVGAAVATAHGRIFGGCNFENSSYGATICAERCAVGHMIAAGEQEIVACAVVTQDEQPAAPCGICRQVLNEFARPVAAGGLKIALVGVHDGGLARRETTLDELLPAAFHLRR